MQMLEDFLRSARLLHEDPTLPMTPHIEYLALHHVQELLEMYGIRLEQFPDMPIPPELPEQPGQEPCFIAH